MSTPVALYGLCEHCGAPRDVEERRKDDGERIYELVCTEHCESEESP